MGNTLRWTVFMSRTFAQCPATGHHLSMGESPNGPTHRTEAAGS
jgi:hypothetical protein